MTRFNVKMMTVNELVERFVAIAVDQDKAIFNEDTAKFNRLYDKMEEVRNELKSRPGDQRSALLPLYTHTNIQVRLRAALTTMEVVPEAAREVFQKIANSRLYPQAAADALAAIWRLDGRPLVPN
jgi:cytochrome c oxidase assembly protein Cox11